MAAIASRRRRRFSLLTCLEHGERFFGSHAATMYPAPEHAKLLGLRGGEERLPGRISVSSGGLIFEPDESESVGGLKLLENGRISVNLPPHRGCHAVDASAVRLLTGHNDVKRHTTARHGRIGEDVRWAGRWVRHVPTQRICWSRAVIC